MTWHRFILLTAIIVLFASWQHNGDSGQPAAEAVKKSVAPAQLLIIRHAEKPTDDKLDIHLTTQGAARAAALPSLFVLSPMYRTKPTRFATPDFIYAAGEKKDSNRPVETVLPLAKSLDDLPIQQKHVDVEPVVAEIFSDAKYAGKTVLISWRHKTLPALAAAIAAKARNADQLKAQVPEKWEPAVFDRVWRFTFDEVGDAVFADDPQKLLFGDAVK